MNNRNDQVASHNRTIRAIVASGSLLAIIFVAVPWVDEYFRLRSDAAELSDLEIKFVETQQREKQLQRIEAKLTGELEAFLARSVEPTKTEIVRQSLTDIVRKARGRLRRLEISAGETRHWAVDNDDPRNDAIPTYGEESRFVLHTHSVELQADGSLEAIRQILRAVADQGWLMTTKGLTTVPTTVRESPVGLELRLVLYGLVPDQSEPEDEEQEFAKREVSRKLR